MSMVHGSRGRLGPGSPQLRSEVAISPSRLRAVRRGHRLAGDGDDYAVIRKHIGTRGARLPLLRGAGGARWWLHAAEGPARLAHFKTATGKARLHVNPPTVVEVPEGHLLLQDRSVARSVQHNRLRAGRPLPRIKGGRRSSLSCRRPSLLRSSRRGDLVDVVEASSPIRRTAPKSFRTVQYPTPRGCAAAYFPEAKSWSLDSTAEISNTPCPSPP